MWNTSELPLGGFNMQSEYWDHGGWWWMIGVHWLIWFLLIALVVAILVASFRPATRDVGGDSFAGGASSSETYSSGRTALDVRFARGEIDRGEYLERKHALS